MFYLCYRISPYRNNPAFNTAIPTPNFKLPAGRATWFADPVFAGGVVEPALKKPPFGTPVEITGAEDVVVELEVFVGDVEIEVLDFEPVPGVK